MIKKLFILTFFIILYKITFSNNFLNINDYLYLIKNGYSRRTINRSYNVNLTKNDYNKLKKMLEYREQKSVKTKKYNIYFKKQEINKQKNIINSYYKLFEYKNKNINSITANDIEILTKNIEYKKNINKRYSKISHKNYKNFFNNKYTNLSILNHKYENQIKILKETENKTYTENIKNAINSLDFNNYNTKITNKTLYFADDSTMLVHSAFADIECLSETDSEHIHFFDSLNDAIKEGYIPCSKCCKNIK